MVRQAFVGVLVAGVILGVVVLKDRGAVGFGASTQTHNGETTISLLPGLPGITLQGDPLYAKDDPWHRYLAPEHMCPGGELVGAPLPDQANTMVCLVNYARAQDGLLPVEPVEVLNLTSLAKASKIIRCTDFNHDACGEDAAADARQAGYNGAWGENLYVAEGRHGSPRVALDGWLNSPHHRENLLTPTWRTQGIAVEKVARFGSYRNVTLWVNQFGT